MIKMAIRDVPYWGIRSTDKKKVKVIAILKSERDRLFSVYEENTISSYVYKTHVDFLLRTGFSIVKEANDLPITAGDRYYHEIKPLGLNKLNKILYGIS